MELEEKVSLFKSTIEERNKKIQDFVEEQRNFMKNSFNNIIKLFFEASPNVKLVTWHQYTPYFNDGEACTFSVGDIYIKLKTEQEKSTGILEPEEYVRWYDDADGYYYIYRDVKKMSEDLKIPLEEAENLRSLSTLINSLEDNLLATFGDHKSIIFFADGKMEITTFDHD